MLDLKTQIQAIKAVWAGRIVTAADDCLWSYLPKKYMLKLGNDYLILKTTVSKTAMFPPLKQIPVFYQEVVMSYNRSKVMTHTEFCDNILNQPIWGNKYLQFKNKTMFFKSWIKEGILLIKNLKITCGKLDVGFLYDRIRDKRKFHTEVNILQNALKRVGIKFSNEPNTDNLIPTYIHHAEAIYNWEIKPSKYYYDHLIEEVAVRPTSERYWTEVMGISEDMLYESYKCKIKNVKDKKLAETNFKILNNILPCNRNLFKWRKSETSLCYFCKEEETISHLLYECTYAKQIWNAAKILLDCENMVTHDMVIFGFGLDMSLIYVFSMIIYYIYKEWLICSLENKERKQNICLKSFCNFLNIRHNLYSNCKDVIWHDVCIRLEVLMCHIESM